MIIQPQFVGDPRPSNSVLRWARGVRQPAGAAAEALFEPPGRGSRGSWSTWQGRGSVG